MLEYLQKNHPKTAGKVKRRDAFAMDDVRRPTPTEVIIPSLHPCPSASRREARELRGTTHLVCGLPLLAASSFELPAGLVTGLATRLHVPCSLESRPCMSACLRAGLSVPELLSSARRPVLGDEFAATIDRLLGCGGKGRFEKIRARARRYCT